MNTKEVGAHEAMLDHHEVLDINVKLRAEAIKHEVGKGNSYKQAVANLVEYLDTEVLPHAIAEERTIYQIAEDKLGLASTVSEMTLEHRALADAITTLKNAANGSEASECAKEISLLFSSHVRKENDLILPQLLAHPQVDLSIVLIEMHALFDADQKRASLDQRPEPDQIAPLLSLLLEATAELARSGLKDQAYQLTASAWSLLQNSRPDLATTTALALHNMVDSRISESGTLSNAANDSIDSELDVRSLHPAQRHSAILAQYRTLPPGSALMVINDHDPKPLKHQFEADHHGEFTWDYLESGPRTWRVRIGRLAK